MKFDEVESFINLEVLIDKNCLEESKLTQEQEKQRSVKLSVYETTLPYQRETWTMTNKMIQPLAIWKRYCGEFLEANNRRRDGKEE